MEEPLAEFRDSYSSVSWELSHFSYWGLMMLLLWFSCGKFAFSKYETFWFLKFFLSLILLEDFANVFYIYLCCCCARDYDYEKKQLWSKNHKIWLYKTNNQVISLIVCQIFFVMYLEYFSDLLKLNSELSKVFDNLIATAKKTK